jgi:hypothetical protein
MDAFTYVTGFFASTPDKDESLPVNEENPNSPMNPGYTCVIA